MNNDVFLNGKPTLDLDISAQLYSYSMTKTWNQSFRLAALMKEEVDPEALQQAVVMLKDRFPSFFVKFCEDFFWKRFQPVTLEECRHLVQKDTALCKPIDTGDRTRPLFRVLYTPFRISFEAFHGLSDGHGAMIFFKTLLAVYLRIKGYEIPNECEIYDINEKPTKEELEDTFLRAYDKKGKRLNRSGKAVYQYKPQYEDGKLHVTQGRFPVAQIKTMSKEKGVTITEYLIATYLYAFYENLDNKAKTNPITIQVPIDIRRLYDSKSLRNCSLYANVTIEPKKRSYTFDDLLTEARTQMKAGTAPQVMQENVNVNVHDSVMPIAQYSPSFLKTPFVKLAFYLYGERLFTTPMSNLGIIQLPEEMFEHIERIDSIIGQTFMNKLYATVGSFRDTMLVTFSSTGVDNKIADTYFAFLKEKGIDVTADNGGYDF